MISTYPPSKKIILCIDNDDAILRYEKASSKGLDTQFSRQHRLDKH